MVFQNSEHLTETTNVLQKSADCNLERSRSFTFGLISSYKKSMIVVGFMVYEKKSENEKGRCENIRRVLPKSLTNDTESW